VPGVRVGRSEYEVPDDWDPTVSPASLSTDQASNLGRAVALDVVLGHPVIPPGRVSPRPAMSQDHDPVVRGEADGMGVRDTEAIRARPIPHAGCDSKDVLGGGRGIRLGHPRAPPGKDGQKHDEWDAEELQKIPDKRTLIVNGCRHVVV